MMSSTIEKLLAARKKQVEELIEIVDKDLQARKKRSEAADIVRRTSHLERLQCDVAQADAGEFNDNAFLTTKMDTVLKLLPKSGQLIEVLRGHKKGIFSIVATDKIGGFASNSLDGRVILWTLHDSGHYKRGPIESRLNKAALSLTCVQGPGAAASQLASGTFDGSIVLSSVADPDYQ